MKEDQERTPLRTILLNFLNHIENLETHRSAEDSYETEFQELKLFSETLKTLEQYSCSEGEKEVNRKKNRYKDILPFDLSRVILNEYAGIPGSDYINANYIKGASGSPAYIASQGPLPHTVNDFWRMVVQCEVQVIVMACNEEEAGKHKCENYWVEGEGDGEEKQFGMVTIRLIKASTVCPDFSVRTMLLKYTNTQSNTEERTVCQFHYSAWPDHGVPPLVRPLLDMVRLVRDTQASETLPVLVHCSAGCGRTGTICAIDYVWGLLRAGKLTKDFSLLSLVREMRKQRIAMVQTKEQYVLVHQAVRELFKEQLRMIDSHPYENIDCNGMPLDTEPTYDTLANIQNTEEKQDNKEKEVPIVAPPLPQKKKFPILSSKQEKEVENLSEKQRIAEQAEASTESLSGGGHRPRIAKLKSLFERETKQVVRSHSLGAPRKTELARKEPARMPIPARGILRAPQLTEQSPALPVKRSKSLRVVGTSDRYKLSIPTDPSPSCDEKVRRLSLESNVDVGDCRDRLSGPGVESIVAGLGIRERRNSFREAVNKAGKYENFPRKPGIQNLVRSYTAIDIRPPNREFERKSDTSKPTLHTKPSNVSLASGNVAKLPQRPIPARPITKTDVTWYAARIDTRQKRNPVSKLPDSTDVSSADSASRQLIRNQNTFFDAANEQRQTQAFSSSVSKQNFQVVKPLPKKDSKLIQNIPKQKDIVPQKHVSSVNKINSVQAVVATNVSYKQLESNVHRMNHEQQSLQHLQRQHQVAVSSASSSSSSSSDKRISSQQSTQNSRLVEVQGQQNPRGLSSQRFNSLVEFDARVNSASQNEVCMPPRFHPMQAQTSSRSQNSRHIVFDSRLGADTDPRCHYGYRREQGQQIAPTMNETPRKTIQHYQKPRQLYRELQSTHLPNRNTGEEVKSSKVSASEITHGLHKSMISPQAPLTGHRYPPDQRANVQHYVEESKLNLRTGNQPEPSDLRYFSNVKSGERKPTSQEQRQNPMAVYGGRLTHYPRQEVKQSTVQGTLQHYPPATSRVVPQVQDATNVTSGASHVDSPGKQQLSSPAEAEMACFGVKLRRGSRDDLALCSGGPVTPSRVKRHASVVLLRNSLIESSDASAPQLSVWNSPPQSNGDTRVNVPHTSSQFKKESEDPWSGAVGVDLDEVAASMTSQKDGSSSKLMKAALHALHQRKGLTSSEMTNEPKYSPGGQPPNYASPPPPLSSSQGPPTFRKQQQYL